MTLSIERLKAIFEHKNVQAFYAVVRYRESSLGPEAYRMISGGGSTVWRYVEYCVRRPYGGTSHRAWVGEALVWHAPDLPTQFSRQEGCASLSIAVPVPQSSPSRDFNFVQRMEVNLNPLRSAQIEYPPIPLRILDQKDCKR